MKSQRSNVMIFAASRGEVENLQPKAHSTPELCDPMGPEKPEGLGLTFNE